MMVPVKRKKFNKLHFLKVSRKLRGKLIFHTEGSSSQVTVVTNQFQKWSLILIDAAACPLSVNSHSTSAITNIIASISFHQIPVKRLYLYSETYETSLGRIPFSSISALSTNYGLNTFLLMM